MLRSTPRYWTVLTAFGLVLALSVACSDGDVSAVASSGNTTAATTEAATETPIEAASGGSTAPADPMDAEMGLTPTVADAGDLVAQGEAIFFKPGLCSTCHGDDATGLVGPNIIGKTADQILLQIETNDAMSVISLSDEELEALEAYLASLK